MVVTGTTSRLVYSLDKGWRFQRQDHPISSGASGCAEPWCQTVTNDSAWRSVSIPHDFVVEGNFTESASMAHGYLPFGVGLYRKTVRLPKQAMQALKAGTHKASLIFDGVQSSATVFVGGVGAATTHSSGYTPFRVDLTPLQVEALLKGGSSALIAVCADARKPDGWWYDGGGIYRHVRLVLSPLTHLAHDGGVYLPTQVVGSIDTATATADGQLMPRVTLASFASAAVAFNISCTIADDSAPGVVLGRSFVTGVIRSCSECPATPTTTTVSLPEILVRRANLWSPDSPSLYAVSVTLVTNDSYAQSSNHTIGFRKTTWDATSGFWLNDVPTKIVGAANHQDFAGVGVAVPDALQAHRIAKLKEMGINGWRTAHNAPTPALLDAADRLGMLVWDENHRNGQDDELRTLVHRDFNHPSIVIWSICNEILCFSSDPDDPSQSKADAQRMHDAFHSLDPSYGRVVSANPLIPLYIDWLGPSPSPMDVLGIDYHTYMYDLVHAANPTKPIISSETSSAVSDRGEYANDQAGGHVSGYDVNKPEWGQTAEEAWGGVGQPAGQGILTRPFVSGGWTWTGWDYKGEPTPDAWPDINSHFGILDIAGFEKDRFYYYQSQTRPAHTHVLHLMPHWNWQSLSSQEQPHLAPCRGPCRHGTTAAAPTGPMTIDVWAFSDGASAELLVNNKSFGRVNISAHSHAQWSAVPYEAGELRAISRDASGHILATESVHTTGPAAALRLSFKDSVGDSTADGHGGGIVAGCADVALVKIEVIDAAGRVVPTANHTVTLAHTGSSAIFLGGGNGDPAEHTPDQSAVRPAYHGLLLGIYQSTSAVGNVTIHASAPGLVSASLQLHVVKPEFASKWWCELLAEL